MQAVTRWRINRGIKGILSVNVNVSLLFCAGGIKIFWPQVNYQPWTIISGKLQERVYLSIVQIIDLFRSLGSVVTWLWTEQAALCFSAEIFTTELKFCFVTRMLQTTQVLVLPFRWEWTTCRYGIFVSLYHACHVSSFFCCCFNISSNISNMRCSVSSPDETPRRELKIRRAAEYFWRTSRCFIWWWNTVSNVWYFFSNKIIFEGEIKDANTKQCFIRFPNTH